MNPEKLDALGILFIENDITANINLPKKLIHSQNKRLKKNIKIIKILYLNLNIG